MVIFRDQTIEKVFNVMLELFKEVRQYKDQTTLCNRSGSSTSQVFFFFYISRLIDHFSEMK